MAITSGAAHAATPPTVDRCRKSRRCIDQFPRESATLRFDPAQLYRGAAGALCMWAASSPGSLCR
ncbi:MAG: hypothetical protein ABI440_12825, partial [Casimicrobiaceae bacterium]